MTFEALTTLASVLRWSLLVIAVAGFVIATLSLFEAQRVVRAGAQDPDRLLLARFRRSSAALSLAAQLAFVAVGVSFVALPALPLTSPAQVGPFLDGMLRQAGFALGALVLALKSLMDLMVESSVAEPRAMREAAHVAEIETMNRRLEQATRAKSEFLASMSHELRTPMNAILGFSDLLREQLRERLTPTQQRYFHNIEDAGHHLLGLINEVLDLSKVEAGRIELRPDVIALPSLAEPVVASARAEAAERGVTFEAEIDQAQVRVDAGRVRQVLYNLLSNAVKFTEPGGRVRIRAAMAGQDLVVDVSDTGIGIPADRRDRVFGTFERLHEGRSDAPGSGLGLALSRHLVELHGGTIGFESAEGHGTTFHVRIPAALTSAMTGARLLIVEDDVNDSELIAAVADGVGLRTEIARSALGAREAIRRDPPTAVVLDLRLPDDRGEHVLEALKADPATRHIPVIVVTVEDDVGRSRPLGADDHITKPIDRERLAVWLRSVAVKGPAA